MRTRGRRALAAVAAAVGVAGLVWMGAAAWRNGWGEADPVGALFGVLALVFSVYVWQRGGAADDTETVAARLAQTVQQREDRALRQLLSGDGRSFINVGFTVTPVGEVELPSTPADEQGVSKIADYYRQVGSGRLVVTGTPAGDEASGTPAASGTVPGVDAGTGKTVAVLKLVQGLINDRQPDEAVPVRLSAGTWPGGTIEDWLVTHLTRILGLRGADAREIVEAELVLPVIDGLDEIDGTDAPGYESRAAKLLKELNRSRSGAGLPAVVTCRASHYAALTAADVQMQDTALLRLDRVNSARARAYLERRVGGQNDFTRRWEGVLNALHPDAQHAASPAVQSALDTPWRLTLAAVVFQERLPNGDYLRHPNELIAEAQAGTLRTYLLDRYLAAAVSTACDDAGTKPPDRRSAARHRRIQRRGADAVWRHLAVLASFLHANAPAGGTARCVAGRSLSGTDLVLHDLWPLAGERLTRGVAVLLAAALIAPAPAGFAMLGWGAGALDLGLLIILGMLVAGPFVMAWLWQPEWPQPHQINPKRLRALRSWRVVAGGALLLLLGLWQPWGWIVAAGCALVIHYRLMGGSHAPITDPRVPLREDFKSWFAPFVLLAAVGTFPIITEWQGTLGYNIAGIAILLGTVVMASSILTSGFLVRRLVIGVTLPFVLSEDHHPVSWVERAHGLIDRSNERMDRGFALGASLRYLAFLLCTRGRLPWRLGCFLGDCYHLGLLRIAGAAWQFRHRELLEHLAARPYPPAA